MVSQGASLSPNTVSTLNTYFYYYLFSPFTCLIAVLLGIPLAITHERSNALGNFVKAAAVLALYYFSTEFFIVLGKNQTIPAVLAGAFPVVLFVGCGLWGARKMI